MSKSIEQKMEDQQNQQKFDNLPEKEQGDIIEEAHGEAIEINREQKEKEQLPVLLIYRDNAQYNEHMPEIAKNLQA